MSGLHDEILYGAIGASEGPFSVGPAGLAAARNLIAAADSGYPQRAMRVLWDHRSQLGDDPRPEALDALLGGMARHLSERLTPTRRPRDNDRELVFLRGEARRRIERIVTGADRTPSSELDVFTRGLSDACLSGGPFGAHSRWRVAKASVAFEEMLRRGNRSRVNHEIVSRALYLIGTSGRENEGTARLTVALAKTAHTHLLLDDPSVAASAVTGYAWLYLAGLARESRAMPEAGFLRERLVGAFEEALLEGARDGEGFDAIVERLRTQAHDQLTLTALGMVDALGCELAARRILSARSDETPEEIDELLERHPLSREEIAEALGSYHRESLRGGEERRKEAASDLRASLYQKQIEARLEI